MSEFADITLLECNRRESTQATSDGVNNALYTNRMGGVISLDTGDTIELKSAFINQRGCANASSIEFKGESLGVQGTFTETTATSELYFYDDMNTNLNTDPTKPYNPVNDPITTNTIQGNLAHRIIENKEIKVDLKDNEANIEVNFYKNANGEGYMMLPRCYPVGELNTDPIGGPTGAKYEYPKMKWNLSDYEKDFDPIHTPAPLYTKGKNSGITYYRPDLSPEYLEFIDAGAEEEWNLFNSNDYHDVADLTNGLHSNTTIRLICKRPRNDNSRFTLFEREYDWMTWGQQPNFSWDPPVVDPLDPAIPVYAEKWWGPDTIPPAVIPWIGGGTNTYPLKYKARHDYTKDPALSTYVKRTDLVKISVNKGFNSPQSISEQITQQLQEQDTNSPLLSTLPTRHEGTTISQTGFENVVYSDVIKTKTFKPIYCAGHENMSKANFDKFMSETPADFQSKEAFDYHTAYHNILVKRPEIFEAGRKINSWTGKVGQAPNFYNPLDPENNLDAGTPNVIQNTMGLDAKLVNNWTDPIVTSWLWSEDNLKMLGDLFEAQGLYPELFENPDGFWASNQVWNNRYYPNFVGPGNTGDIEWMPKATINNSRFLHINRFDYVADDVEPENTQKNFRTLGSDGYLEMTYDNGLTGDDKRTYDASHMSAPVFFSYQPGNKRKMTDGSNVNNLAYGFATKSQPRFFDGGLDENYYITLHPEECNGIRPEVFSQRGGQSPAIPNPLPPYDTIPGIWNPKTIVAGECTIGWDYHFNSWGNVVMLPYTGLLSTNYDGTWVTGQNRSQGYLKKVDTYDKFRQTYIGSNNSACVYDPVTGKFGWEYLHVPENVGNKYNGGSEDIIDKTATTPPQSVPIIEDAGNECYKMNKRLQTWTFCPDMVPYVQIAGEAFRTVDSPPESGPTAPVELDPFNNNLEPWVVYDSHMGINLNLGKCFDIDTTTDAFSQDEIWNSGLLGILGFSREQFNPTVINALNNGEARVRYENIRSLYNPTTNSQPTSADTKQFIMNPYGAVQYTTQLPMSLSLPFMLSANKYHTAEQRGWQQPGVEEWGIFPAIVIDTSSIKIEGVNLPKVLLRPYLTIRSDVLSSTKYIGGKNSGLTLPIMAVVNKINADKDFIQLEGSETFTITHPTTFSSITTAICDPDGTLALVDDSSAVIYKISKMGNLSNFDILSQIKATLKKSGK